MLGGVCIVGSGSAGATTPEATPSDGAMASRRCSGARTRSRVTLSKSSKYDRGCARVWKSVRSVSSGQVSQKVGTSSGEPARARNPWQGEQDHSQVLSRAAQRVGTTRRGAGREKRTRRGGPRAGTGGRREKKSRTLCISDGVFQFTLRRLLFFSRNFLGGCMRERPTWSRRRKGTQ